MIAGQTGSEDQTIHVHGCLSPANDVVLQNDASGAESYGQPCYKIPSIPAELSAAGLTWKYYGTAPVWDAPQYVNAIKNSPAISSNQILTDAKNNQLPTFTKTVGKMDEYEGTTTLAPGPHTYQFKFSGWMWWWTGLRTR